MLKAWRRLKNYVKYDLKEIIAPSSLPYPPGEEPAQATWKDFFQTLRLATRDYMDTWKPEKQEPAQELEEQSEHQEAPLSEELVGVARSGAESVKPILQQLYRTRAAAYQEAVSSFVQGYREGFAGLPDSDDVADESPKGSPSDASRAPPADSQGRGQGSAAEPEASAEREPLHEKGSTHDDGGNSADLKPLRAEDSLDEKAAGKILRPSTAANDGESRLRHGTSGMHD